MISFFMQHIPPVYLLLEICTERPEGFVSLGNLPPAIPQMEFKMDSLPPPGVRPATVILTCRQETPVYGASPYPPSKPGVMADTPAVLARLPFQGGKPVL
jgi:hypothetical protein